MVLARTHHHQFQSSPKGEEKMPMIKTIVSFVSTTMFLLVATGCGVQGDEPEAQGYVPECTPTVSCGQGYYCDNGMCMPSEPEYPRCEDASDCRADEVCVNGTCASEPVDPECRDESDCDPGYTCDHGSCHAHPEPTVDAATPPPACTGDTWTCEEWSACSDGRRTRECTMTSDCASVSTPSPATSQACATVDAGTDDEPEYLPDPVISPKACVLDFSSYYMSGSTEGEVRGTLPMMDWTDGLGIADPDTDDDYGYAGLTMRFDVPEGTYDISYLGYQGERPPASEAWAQYGLIDDLLRMRPEALEYIQCNWYKNGEIVDVSAPKCFIRISVDEDCVITGAGNMGDFAG
jgi:hypothetical protein